MRSSLILAALIKRNDFSSDVSMLRELRSEGRVCESIWREGSSESPREQGESKSSSSDLLTQIWPCFRGVRAEREPVLLFCKSGRSNTKQSLWASCVT